MRVCFVAQPCLTLCKPCGLQSARLVCLGSQIRVLQWVARSFLQGIFLTQGSHTTSYISCVGRRVLYH